MPFVKFQHKSYGIMITAPENWIQYELFDAADEEGNMMPVYRTDCEKPQYFEE